MTNQEKKIEDHPLIVMNQDGEVNLTATIKAAKKDVLTSLLERGPKLDKNKFEYQEIRFLEAGFNKANQEWRELINLMINECK